MDKKVIVVLLGTCLVFIGLAFVASTVYAEVVESNIDYHMQIPTLKHVLRSSNPIVTLYGVGFIVVGFSIEVLGLAWLLLERQH